MNLLIKYISVFACTAISFQELAFSGAVDGGGGVGVRCPAQQIFELLDIHEARLAGFKINHNPKSEEGAVQLTANLFSNHFWNPDTFPKPEYRRTLADKIVRPIFMGKSFIDYSNGQKIDIQFGPDLPLSKDIGQYNVSPGCHLEQVAFFDDATRVIKISRLKWNELSWLDRAALVSHELTYFIDRREGMENFSIPHNKITSERSRHFIGQLFSVNALVSKANSIPESNFFDCGGGGSDYSSMSYFYAFDNYSGGVTTVFNIIHGRSSSYQMTAIFNGINMNSLLDEAYGQVNTTADLIFSSEFNAPSFQIKIVKRKNSLPQFQAFLNQNGILVPVAQSQEIACSAH